MVPSPYENQPRPGVFARTLYEDASLATAYDAAGWNVSMILPLFHTHAHLRHAPMPAATTTKSIPMAVNL